MKKAPFLFLVFLGIINVVAQVGIGTTNPDSSSILELNSSSQGFLTPRMTTTQRNDIAAPVAGLMIYNTIDNCFQYYNGTAWSLCLGTEPSVKSLVCPPEATANGIFVQSTALTVNNKIIVSVATTSAASYDITTSTVNGYSFSAAGLFPSAGTYIIELVGTGTPTTAQTDTFIISMLGSVGTCSLDIEVLGVAPPIYANCKEYLTNGFTTSGIYTIDPDGTGVGDPEFDCYCDMVNDGGGWTLVFRHDSSGGFFVNDAEADSFNESSPGLSTTKYSILNKIDAIKAETKYEFRLSYPDVSIINHWKQTFDPRSGSSGIRPVLGYEVGSGGIGSDTNFWGGLENSSDLNTYLDGSVNSANWWYSIGSVADFSGGMPGPLSSVVTKVELYIR